jgi:hypothetical protein
MAAVIGDASEALPSYGPLQGGLGLATARVVKFRRVEVS